MWLSAMSPGPTFDRVYAALKEQLLSGRWAPGTHLEPASLGEDLVASITPVRDALHRLVGERLVEAPRHDGFWVPSPTEGELRDLYEWNGDLLAWTLRLRRRIWSMPHECSEAPTPPEAPMLFLEIARMARYAELERAVAVCNDRLAAYRAAEAEVFGDVAGELASLHLCLLKADPARLRREIATYHKRRQRAVPALLAQARRNAAGASLK